MANLSNCAVTQYGPIMEFAGDASAGLGGGLEKQSPPDDTFFQGVYGAYTSYQEGQAGAYVLEISSNPGYHVHAGLITIQDAPIVSTAVSQYNLFTQEQDEYPNSIRTFSTNTLDAANYGSSAVGSSGDAAVNQIITWDSNRDEWWKCDNKVRVLVLMPNFVMPENDVTIKIDFEGDAVACDEVNPYEEEEVQEDKTLLWELTTGLIITNEFRESLGGNQLGATVPKSTFAAKYYDADYVQNQFDSHYITNYFDSNNLDINPVYGGIQYAANLGLAPFALEYFNPNLSGISSWGFPDCTGQTQPSCFEELGANSYRLSSFTTDVPSGAPFDISTDEGKLMIPYHGGWPNNFHGLHPNYISEDLSNALTYNGVNVFESVDVFQQLSPLHSNYKIYQNAPSGITVANASFPQTLWTGNPDFVNWPYPNFQVAAPELSLETNPVIYPGGGQVPASETWEIEISGWQWAQVYQGLIFPDGFGYDLIAEPEFVDVWGAVTIVTVQNGQQMSPTLSLSEWKNLLPYDFYNNYEYSSQNSINLGSTFAGGNASEIIPYTELNSNNSNFNKEQVTYAFYTAVDNQCDLDLSKATLTQVTPTRVRISVPYRSDLGWIRSLNENGSGIANQRFNKIFVNIHPVKNE